MIKSLKLYHDLELDRVISVGEVLSVDEERENYLVKIGYAEKIGADVKAIEAKKAEAPKKEEHKK